jgi:hypothetical protein
MLHSGTSYQYEESLNGQCESKYRWTKCLPDMGSILDFEQIAANLTLTESEATKFWPVYEQYSAEFGKINDTRTAVIKEYAEGYGTLTDDQADNLIRRWLDTDITAAQVRQKYVPIFRKVLTGKEAATFFQLDRRISMMIDVQLTSRLPLVQSQDQ